MWGETTIELFCVPLWPVQVWYASGHYERRAFMNRASRGTKDGFGGQLRAVIVPCLAIVPSHGAAMLVQTARDGAKQHGMKGDQQEGGRAGRGEMGPATRKG